VQNFTPFTPCKPVKIALINSNMLNFMTSLMKILKKSFQRHSKHFVIQGEQAEMFIVQCDFTGNMEATGNIEA